MLPLPPALPCFSACSGGEQPAADLTAPPPGQRPAVGQLARYREKNYVKSGSKYKAKTKIVKSFIKKGDKSQTKIRLKTQIHEIQKVQTFIWDSGQIFLRMNK